MTIRTAKIEDADVINQHDEWIDGAVLTKKIADGTVYVVYDNDEFVGWLRCGLFWDNTPFMNMLYILEPYQRKGIGRQLVEFWEREMQDKGYKVLLTSTAQTEYAQHFYDKLGYKAIGSFILASEPLEIMLAKFIQ